MTQNIGNFFVENKGSNVLKLQIEPAGDWVPLAPGARVKIEVLEGPGLDPLEIDAQDGTIVVHGWVRRVSETLGNAVGKVIWSRE